MPMRVIAGVYRHRSLQYPENNKNIRPTKDRIREAFFSSLGDISNCTFLDVCAGCGSIGIEAISRGAKKSIFIDNNKESINYIKNNLKSLKIDNYELLEMDALGALETMNAKEQKVDIVYIDPPYESDVYSAILSFIYNSNLLSKNNIVAFECNKDIEINPSWFSKIKEYHYGEIKVVVLKN